MDAYKSTFDVVICNDSDLKFVYDIVKYIVEEDDFPCLDEEEEEEGEEYIVVPPSLGSSVCCNKHTKESLRLSIHDISGDIHCKKRFPHVSIVQQLGFVIHQFLTSLCSELQKRILHNSIHRTSFLAETTENAAGLIQIIASRSTESIWTYFLFLNSE